MHPGYSVSDHERMSFTIDQLAEVARGLGGEQVTYHGGKIQCSCLLAHWTHSGGRDSSPSMVLYVDGRHGPTYGCLACKESGTLRDLVLFMWSKTGKNLFWLVDMIDGEDAPDSKKISERLMAKAQAASTVGFQTRTVAATIRAPEKQIQAVGKGPWYDYQCIAKADEQPEIPEESITPYLGSVPRYAIDRGLTPETCKEWELGNDKKKKRLLIPMRDHRGRLVAVTGRLYACNRCGHFGRVDELGERHWVLKEDGKRPVCEKCGSGVAPKYMHSKGFKKNLLLYGEHRRTIDKGRIVYVVEGHLDVILMWQLGYRPVVGMMGSNPGAAQIEKLVRYWERAVIVPDGDDAGIKMARSVKRMVSDRIPVTSRPLPPGEDPGSLVKLRSEVLVDILGKPPVSVDPSNITG
jgi:hypothetical protein